MLCILGVLRRLLLCPFAKIHFVSVFIFSFCAYSKFAKFVIIPVVLYKILLTIQVLRFVIFSVLVLFESWFRALPYPGMTIAGGCLKITQQFSGDMFVAKIRGVVKLVSRLIYVILKSESEPELTQRYRSCQPVSPHSAAAAYARVYPSALLPDGLTGASTRSGPWHGRRDCSPSATVRQVLFSLLSGGQLIL